MKKPNNYDNMQAFGEFTPIELGGHILIIKKINVIKDEHGQDKQVEIMFDTHGTDKQANYFTEQYKNDTRQPKIWGGTRREWLLTSSGKDNPFFINFCKSAEKSNNFKIDWDKFESSLTNKLVGGVFGREQYLKDGQVKTAIKCVGFRSVEAIKAGVEIPKDKLVGGSNIAQDDLVSVHDDGDSPF